MTKLSLVGDALVCGVCGSAPRLSAANANCVKQDCSSCGFAQLWTRGLRPKLVHSNGKLKPGVSRVWLTQMEWDRLKTGGDDSTSEDDLRQRREGTLIDLLDEFEPIQNSWVPHRFLISHAKVVTTELDENSMPGLVEEDVDYSENGQLVRRFALQRDYWTIISYTLLIAISAFLVSSVWRDRRSALAKGVAVTVEQEGASEVDSLVPGI